MKNNIAFRLLMLLTMFFGALSVASAADRFFVDAANIEPGETKQLAFNLDNSHEFFGFQADITLPDGLEIVMLNSKPDFKLSSRANSSYAPVSNMLSVNAIRLGAFSTNHTAIFGDSGALLYLNVKASESFTGGTLSVSDILFTDASNNDVQLPDFSIELGTQHNDTFYIPDFKIAVGETKEVSLKLDNETSFTAFQTDIYLPEGLVLADANPTLTTRGSDHTLSAKAFTDGRIRLACLSLNNTLFSGNSGALVAIKLTATKDVAEACIIEMKNQRFSMSNAREYVLPNSSTTVTTERALVETINLERTSVSLVTGETYQLSAEVLPTFASTKELAWTSSDSDIVSVSESGLLTAIAPGNATVTASAVDGSGVTATCEVTVTGIPVTNMTLSQNTGELKVTETLQLSATVFPANAYDKSVTWSSSDETVATVDGLGLITAVKEGATIITATSVSNPEVIAICDITVIPTPVSSIVLNQTDISLEVGQQSQLEATVLPQTATVKDLAWRSADSTVVDVDGNGLLSAKALGTTIIIAEASDGSGVTATCSVNVVPTMATGIIIIAPESTSFKVGETIQLSATLTPDNATDKSIAWNVSNSGIAEVDGNGLVTAISEGKVVVKATNSAGVSDEITLTVIPTLAESITINPTAVTLRVGQSVTLMPSISPATTTNKVLLWSSSDDNIVVVDESGIIKAMGIGEATITVASTDGSNVSATAQIVVEPTPATGISINYDGKTSLYVGEKIRLSATVSPDDATDKSIVWQSQSVDVVTVDNNGEVTATGLGEAWVSATNSAGQSAFIIFNVVPTPVSSITLNTTEISIKATETFKLSAVVLPDDATDKRVSFASNNSSVAVVNANGVVTAISVGITEIIVTANDASGVTASCIVTVIPTPVESINITADGSTILKAAQTLQLHADVLPATATDKSVLWTSSNDDIASVDAVGIVTAHNVGTATITAIAGDKSDNIEILVEKTLAESITLNRATAAMKVTGTMQLSATFTPETTTDKSVTWSSSNATIADVSSGGLVTAKALGDCVITATANDGSGVSATCSVTVGETAAESIKISPEGSFTLKVGETKQFSASVMPESTTDKSVTWMSQTSGITVDNNGLATAVSPVENNWISATNSAGQTDYVLITVLPILAESIELSPTDTSLKVGEMVKIVSKVLPENTTDQSVSYKNLTPEIVSVTSEGVVTALSLGDGMIEVLSNDASGVKATAAIHVVPTLTESIEIAQPVNTSFKVGETIALTATVFPENATDKSITWSTSDVAIASVNANGLVAAQSVGNVTITAAASGGQTASISLTVIPTLAESIVLNRTSVEMEVDETLTLTATILPNTTTNKQVMWTTDAPEIVSVDEKGLLHANAIGTATILVTTVDGSEMTARCEVNVVPTPVESVKIIYDGPTIVKVGFSTQMKADVNPANATDQSLEWFGQNDNIIHVERDGLITATGPGETWVAVSATSNGKVDYIWFTVQPNIVESIELSAEKNEIKVGESTQLSALVNPDNATNKTIYWESNDESIATVDQQGLVTGVSVGEVDINAHATDGSNISQTIRINVVATPVESISIIPNGSTRLKDGETVELSAIVQPTGATYKSVTWTSSNEQIATVDEDGVVTAHSQLGDAIIHASAHNGISSSIVITVEETPVELLVIHMNNDKSEFIVGETFTYDVEILPTTATNKALNYSVSDESVIKLSSSNPLEGEVLAPGEAYLIATAEDGVTTSQLITVKPILIERIELPHQMTVPLFQESGEKSQPMLEPKIYPENATIKTLHWTSSNPAVGSVNENNVFVAEGIGTTTVTCYTEDGSNVTASCDIAVIIPVSGVSLNEHNLSLKEQQTFELVAQIEPADVTSYELIWDSTDDEIASVENGIVEAKNEGVCIISVTATSGIGTSYSDVCSVSVSKESGVETISIDDVCIKVDGNKVMIENLPPASQAYIYSLDGILLEHRVSDGNVLNFNLSHNNCYIVSIGKYAVKVALK